MPGYHTVPCCGMRCHLLAVVRSGMNTRTPHVRCEAERGQPKAYPPRIAPADTLRRREPIDVPPRAYCPGRSRLRARSATSCSSHRYS
jgi:hypothetical protein